MTRRRLYDITWLAERVCDDVTIVGEALGKGSPCTMWFDIKNRTTFHAWLHMMEGDPIVIEIDERKAHVKHPDGETIVVDVRSDYDIAKAVCKQALAEAAKDPDFAYDDDRD